MLPPNHSKIEQQQNYRHSKNQLDIERTTLNATVGGTVGYSQKRQLQTIGSPLAQPHGSDFRSVDSTQMINSS